MDARKLGEITGTRPATLLSWIQRGFVPGVGIDVSGKRKDFNPELATRIAIMAELMPLGFPSLWAGIAAKSAVDQGLLLGFAYSAVIRSRDAKMGGDWGSGTFTTLPIKKLEDLVQKLGASDDASNAYVVINVERIAEKVRQAEEEYQASRKARAAKADG